MRSARWSDIASPFKNDALALLKKYKPSAAIKAEEITRSPSGRHGERPTRRSPRTSGSARLPCSSRPYARPITVREIEKLNLARYNLAFCYYMNKQFYEADVLAEHLARRYPQGGLSSKATADRHAVAGGRL